MAYLGNQGEFVTKVVFSNMKGKVDNVDMLPNEASTGDLYVIDESDSADGKKGFIKADNGDWVDLGYIQGIQGIQGVPGPIGSIVSTEIVRNVDIEGTEHFPTDSDWDNYKGAAGSKDVYKVASSDGGSVEVEVYNGNDGISAINDEHTSLTTVWSSEKNRLEILKNRPQLPNVVASMIF